MAVEGGLDAQRTAVLSMDLHAGIVAIYTQGDEGFLARAAEVLRAARERGFTVMHVKVGFRPGFPEVSPNNKAFHALRSDPQRQKLFSGPGAEIHPAVAPVGDEVVITKHRVSAFAGTDLEMILRSRSIDTLVLFGIATSGVVLSTLVEAFDKDFRVVVIGDCCADTEPDLHRALLDKLFAKRGTVMDSEQWAVISPQ
ncbi:MAG: isochorismatase family cysteine hydrolase [Acidobacteriaceae bacterium]